MPTSTVGFVTGNRCRHDPAHLSLPPGQGKRPRSGNAGSQTARGAHRCSDPTAGPLPQTVAGSGLPRKPRSRCPHSHLGRSSWPPHPYRDSDLRQPLPRNRPIV